MCVADEYGDRLTPVLAARYNGIARITRADPHYTVECYDADLHDPAAVAIVPFDAGRVSIALHGRGQPRVTAHLFGGGEISIASEVEGERVAISAMIRAPDGTPVEWIEVQFDARAFDSS